MTNTMTNTKQWKDMKNPERQALGRDDPKRARALARDYVLSGGTDGAHFPKGELFGELTGQERAQLKREHPDAYAVARRAWLDAGRPERPSAA